MLKRALAAVIAVASMFGSLAGSASAQGAGAEPTSASASAASGQRIQVLIAADPVERDALSRVLPELMQRLSVEVEIGSIERVELRDVLAPVPSGPRYLARCFVDLRAERQAVLYVHDPVRDRVLERRIERAPGDQELAREELGHMLLAAIEALQSGATLGAPRSEVEAAAAPAATPDSTTAPAPTSDQRSQPRSASPRPEPARAGWALRGALLYEVAALGHGPGISHGPLLAASIRAPFQLQLGLLLSAQYRLPFDVDADPVGMRMHAFALRALATFESALGRRVALRVGFGAGADVTHLAPRAAAAERNEAPPRSAGAVPLIDLTAARTLTLGVTRGLIGIDVRLSRLVALWAALAADVDLERNEYVLVKRTGGDSEVVAPWRVRPALSLGVVLP